MKVGNKAPDFSVKNQYNEEVVLSKMLAEHPVVLFFYPKDNTPGCIKEVCAFRDSYEAFRDAGAAVVGVSSDSVGSHLRFGEKHKLPYYLLSDPAGRIRKLFGVARTLGFLPGRVTYLIAQDGTVKMEFSALLDSEKHVTEALSALKRMKMSDLNQSTD